MTQQETIAVVLIAALSLAAIFVLLRIFSNRYGQGRGERRDGVVIERRQIGTSWHLSLKTRHFPAGLRVGRPPSPAPPDLVPLREGVAAWGPGARRRFREGTPLFTAWANAEASWSLTNGTLDTWVREARMRERHRMLDARVEEGLRLAALLRGSESS